MAKTEITIVTAFFDINRKNYKENSRTNEEYAKFFEFWARIRNNIIVYTDSNMAKKVESIRKKFNLIDKTQIVIVDDVTTIEPDFLSRMKSCRTTDFLNFRYIDNNADNDPYYNYIMFLKSWFVKDAVEKGYAKGLIAWLDFGFNHGGAVFPNEEEFDYLWEVNLPMDKITMFSFNDDDNKPIFRIVESYDVYIMGAPFIVPDKLAKKFWDLIKRSMDSLLNCGFIDDDQTLMLMASRIDPSLFNIIKSTWFMPLKICGGNHLNMRVQNNKISLKDKILHKYRVIKRNRRHTKNLKKMFNKKD